MKNRRLENFYDRSVVIYFDDAADWQPGKLGQLAPAAAIEGKQIVGRAGACTFWDGRIVHTGSPNVRELPRMAAFARWADAESRDCDEPIYFVSAAKPLCRQHCRPCPQLSTPLFLLISSCALAQGESGPGSDGATFLPLDSPLRRSQKRYIVPENMWENYGDCMRANGARNARL